MKYTSIHNILTNPNFETKLTVCGWVKSYRQSKNLAFVIINDGSTQKDLQLVILEGTSAFSEVSKCSTGTSITAQGKLKESQGKKQNVELEVESLQIFQQADPLSYPLQKKGHSLEFLREIAHLRGRTNTFRAIFRIRNLLAFKIHDFFQQQEFLWVHTPIITSSDCEGAGALFQVTTLDLQNLYKTPNGVINYEQDFFGKKAHLTVSGQLEGEALALSFSKIYTFGPTFRAENSNTTRHLAEFWMIEPEIAFADLKDIMFLAEDFIKFLCKELITHCEDELKFLESHYKTISIDNIAQLSSQPFSHITYSDAITELQRSHITFEYPVKWGHDLQSEHEKYLTDKVFKGPVIVTDYPKEIKAFYMKLNDDNKTVAAMDVLLPKVGEIIGGSQREDRYEVLKQRIDELGLNPQELWWYLDLRRYGSVPHAGFGLGFERLIQYLTGMQNIRDVIPFPRAPHLIGF